MVYAPFSWEGDFRASFAGKFVRSMFPPKLHRKFHHQTSLRGSGWRWALEPVIVDADVFSLRYMSIPAQLPHTVLAAICLLSAIFLVTKNFMQYAYAPLIPMHLMLSPIEVVSRGRELA